MPTSSGSARATTKTKLQDVARLAEVSPATVSRVLNHPELVRPELRERVARIIQELSYTRDNVGRALKSGRTLTIGAVVPTLGISIFADGVEALQDRLRHHGFTLLIANTQYDQAKELADVRSLVERGVDGVVLVGDQHDPALCPLLRQHGVPFVTTYVGQARSQVPAVGIDNAQATFDLATVLLDQGHRRFGVIANLQRSNDRSKARFDGIVRALAGAGLELPRDHVVRARYSLADGRRACRELIGRDPAITAMMCTTDVLAIGAMAEARALGLRVPQDISVTGFDDVAIASQVDPPLTTVSVPAVAIGRTAAETLVAMIAGQPIEPSIRLPYRLMVRGSTGAPP